MDFFSSLSVPALWAILALATPLAFLAIGFFTSTLKSGEITLFGRTFAQRTKAPALFWTLLADSLLVASVLIFVMISVTVELFMVRA
jgi:hypothetical protein